ncbi:MAG: translation initiation factor IF-2 subunit alpha [Euryarchaeota archaeon]|nr:translation initiation factor IF-2 subunit alpha [Euryarchaeota archaeon]
MVRSSEFPEEAELVVCTVQNVRNFGAFVTLDEYGGKEGFIHIRDVATGWVKYIRDYVREGQKIVCKVLGVDSSKGHIDLSLKSVNEHQRREKIQEWKNENKAEKLMEILAERLGKELIALYEEFGYDLMSTYGTLFGAFEQVAAHPETLEEEEFSGEWMDAFIEVAKENVTPPHVQIDGYLELICPEPDGVDKIREALLKGEASSNRAKIQYIGAPRYRVVITAPDYKTAEEDLKDVTAAVIEKMEECEGSAVFHREGR